MPLIGSHTVQKERNKGMKDSLVDAKAQTVNLKALPVKEARHQRQHTRWSPLQKTLGKARLPDRKQIRVAGGRGHRGKVRGSRELPEVVCPMPMLFPQRGSSKHLRLCGLMQALFSLCH